MRRKFEDRLARVRRVREIEERIARAEWGLAAAAASEAGRERESQAQGLTDARQACLDNMREGAFHPPSALLDQRALDQQVARLIAADEAWLTRQSQAHTLAEAWRERDSKRRALSELAERARTRHRLELQANENADMDEVAGQRRARLRRLQDQIGTDSSADPEMGSSSDR